MKESEGVSLWHCLPPNVVFFILLISGYLALVWVQFPKEFQAKNTLKKSQLLNEFLNLKKKTKKWLPNYNKNKSKSKFVKTMTTQ